MSFFMRIVGYDIIGVVETWANTEVLDSELQIHGYIMYRLDREHKSGGGLVLYVKDDFQSSLCMSLMNSGFEESLWCTIKIQNSYFLIGLCYRCPSSTSENDNLLLSLLDAVSMQVNVSRDDNG